MKALGTVTDKVLVVTGLAFEAAIVRDCAGVEVWFGVGNAALTPQAIAAAAGAIGIVSFGTAGGLDPALQPGDIVLADAVCTDDDDGGVSRYPCDERWLTRLAEALPDAHRRILFAASDPVVTAADKAALFARTGAAAVDMESHHLAQLAAQHQLPFIACRIVIDRATHSLPDAALAGMSTDGQTHILPILLSLLRRPSQLPSLLRLGQDAGTAKRAMQHVSRRLPSAFGFSQ